MLPDNRCRRKVVYTTTLEHAVLFELAKKNKCSGPGSEHEISWKDFWLQGFRCRRKERRQGSYLAESTRARQMALASEKPTGNFMLGAGLEPAREDYSQRILSPLCLPFHHPSDGGPSFARGVRRAAGPGSQGGGGRRCLRF